MFILFRTVRHFPFLGSSCCCFFTSPSFLSPLSDTLGRHVKSEVILLHLYGKVNRSDGIVFINLIYICKAE